MGTLNQLPKGQQEAITLFTSGQYLGSMIDKIACALSKDALIGLCKQLSVALAKKIIQRIVLTQDLLTGYLTGEDYNIVANMFPNGRWDTLNDVARLMHFLQSDYSTWITG